MSETDLSIRAISPADLLGPGLGALQRLGGPRPAGGRDALVQAAKDFESVLLHKLMEEMQNTIPDSGLLGDGAMEQLQGMFWGFLARDVADKGGIGLWKDLYEQWAAPAGSADGASAPKEPL